MISFSQLLVSKLWWGKLRRPFEAITRRIFLRRKKIQIGPLRGSYIDGGLSQILGIYELHVQNIILENLRRGQVFYDIGANNGYFSLIATKLIGLEGQIYAFEPFPQNIQKIQSLVDSNHITNVQIVPLAISDVTGIANLSVRFDTTTLSLVGKQTENFLEVRTISMDDFVTSHHFPDLIKLDVEGAENLVMRGSRSMLTKSEKPAWIIEIHSEINHIYVKSLLQENGYEIFEFQKPSRIDIYPRILFARKPS